MCARLRGLLLSILLAALPIAAGAQERPLDAPRAAGQIGERYDGLAVLHDPNAPADVRALVDQVNARRSALYKQRAASDGATVDAVGRIYAKEILSKAPAGTWFLQESGQWVRK
jgi:uncharacterized protein YdbL (DUF1318 family)